MRGIDKRKKIDVVGDESMVMDDGSGVKRSRGGDEMWKKGRQKDFRKAHTGVRKKFIPALPLVVEPPIGTEWTFTVAVGPHIRASRGPHLY